MPDRDAKNSILSCYRCGTSLAALSLPLSRLDLCPGCGVELHVCRMCRHYAPAAPDACNEDDAIEVRNKTGANFCDYFDPDPAAFDGTEQQAEAKARGKLDALFGSEALGKPGATSEAAADEWLQQAEDLFKK
jgi:predicted RNA-binding Zn-ribbon protein involved in translation (DUF1610 family)